MKNITDEEEKKRQEESEALKSALREASKNVDRVVLNGQASGDVEEILLRQVGMLDAVFRQLLLEGNFLPSRKIPYYCTAIKTQNQFRQTLLALNTLKDKGTDGAKK